MKNKIIRNIFSFILAGIMVLGIGYPVSVNANNIDDTDDFGYLETETYVTNDGDTITYAESIQLIKNDATVYMTAMGISANKQKLVLNDIEEQLLFLQYETEKRVLGDHGIRHVAGNWERSKAYFDSRQDISPEMYLATLIAQLYHDTGYTMNECLIPLQDKASSQSKHDVYSLAYLQSEEDYSVYKSIFSPDIMNNLEHALGTHNSSNPMEVAYNTSKYADIITSTLHIADKLALSSREKMCPPVDSDDEMLSVMQYFYKYKNASNSSDYNKMQILSSSKRVFDSNYGYGLTERYVYALNTDLTIGQANFSNRMCYLYTPSNSYQYDSSCDENVITLYIVNYGANDPYENLAYKGAKKIIEDLIMPYDGEDEKLYDAKIEAVYNMARSNGGYLFEDNRGLRLLIKDIKVEDIPNSEDYVRYHNNLLKVSE